MANQTDTVDSATEIGKGVKSRIKTASQARSIFQRLRKNDEPRAYSRAKIQGLIDGQAPYSPAELRRRGQSWRANVNFREAEAAVEKRASSLWELFMEVPTLVQCMVDFIDGQNPNFDYGQIIEEEFTRMLQEWDGFFYEILFHVYEVVTYGKNLLFWPDRYDWRFESSRTGSVLVPSKSRNRPDKMKYVLIRDEMDSEDLFDKVKDVDSEKRATSQGWDPEAIKATLVNVYLKGQASRNVQEFPVSDWESYQLAVNTGLLSAVESDFEGIRVVHELVTETDNKVTHLIIPEAENVAKSNASAQENFLFYADRRYDTMMDVAFAFFLNIGQGMYHTVKGIGHKIFPHMELSNRFINTTLDGSMVAGSLLVQPKGTTSDYRLMRIGPITSVPKDLDIIQSSFTPPIDKLISARVMLNQILNNNTGVFKASTEHPGEPDRTLGEVQLKAQEEARFERNEAEWQYVQWDKFMQAIFKRVTAEDYPSTSGGYLEKQNFIDRCVKRGVPRNIINSKHCLIRATRAIGLGSPTIRSIVTTELFNNRGAYDERGRQNIIRDWTAARSGYWLVDRYAPPQDRNRIPTSEHSLATLENNDLSEGKPIPVGVDQPHVIHLQIHVPPLLEIVQVFENQPDRMRIQEAALYMKTGIGHITKHIQMLAQDPTRKSLVEDLSKVLRTLTEAFDKMATAVGRQEQAKQKQAQEQIKVVKQAQQQIQSGEMQEKLAKVAADLEVEMFRQTEIAKVREIKAVKNLELKERQVNADIVLKQRTAAAEATEGE